MTAHTQDLYCQTTCKYCVRVKTVSEIRTVFCMLHNCGYWLKRIVRKGRKPTMSYYFALQLTIIVIIDIDYFIFK